MATDPPAQSRPPILPNDLRTAVNSLFASLGIESWKPVLAALLLPPVPFLLLVLIGARLLLPRRGLGWLVIVVSVALLWSSACTGAARLLSHAFLPPPAALGFDRVRELRAEVAAKKPLAIVILGAGAEPFAPEYGVSSLQAASLERLRYGVWLAGQTGAPLAFSGGVGRAQQGTTAEARVAAKIAADEFARPIRWVEGESSDTRENAAKTMALLKPAGIDHIVLVTHGYHMARALRAFTEAAGPAVRIEPAPMGLATGLEAPPLEWLPSSDGFRDVRRLLRELAGLYAGA
ncbi:MAG TPA: YdcF family protein [Caldimonas sp.]